MDDNTVLNPEKGELKKEKRILRHKEAVGSLVHEEKQYLALRE
jgi:hypothetical protein